MKRKKKIPLATGTAGDEAVSSTQTPQSGEFSLYFHIPFCTRKCDYCHFYVVRDNEKLKLLFLDALEKEWHLRSKLFFPNKPVSIYFGGGTPSLLEPNAIEKILSWIEPSKECEITLEANPENITIERVREYREIGINRLSIGIQSLDDALLSRLGRTHTAEKASRSVEESEQAGITNISIDLMFDLPNQTVDSWRRTLTDALSLPITHLSLYNMTLEPPALFYKKREQIAAQMPDEAMSLKMLQLAVDEIERSGLRRYEISAFARAGFASRHNLGYWTGRPFVGFGPSAFSYWNGVRFRNCANLIAYANILEKGEDPIDFSEKLTSEESRKESLAVALRIIDGVHIWPDELKQKLFILMEQDFVEQKNKRYRLTQKGLMFHNTIAQVLFED